LESKALAERISQLLLEKKTADIVIMDLRELASFTDYFVIGSVDTDIQAKAVMDHLEEQLLAEESVKPWHVEGGSGSSWVLLDFVDVVVHVFRPEARAFYALEKLWGDAEIVEIRDEA
jgi:ribosome-associated protein